MAGHSKWSQIKHKKAKTDAQKGKEFTKIVREITVATRQGGGPDPASNHRLRLAIQKAKECNMPAENVKRAIQKGSGNDADSHFDEVMFEAYGPAGVGILILCLTDNKNRTIPNLRVILNKNGGNMANNGAVSYQFSKKGYLVFEPGCSVEKIIDIASQFEIDDFDEKQDHSVELLMSITALEPVKESFDKHSVVYVDSGISMIPSNFIQVSKQDYEKIVSLIEKLEEDDDVQTVYTNMMTSHE
jgi:transcriptional/translational regulatory protein YebC/TACO1